MSMNVRDVKACDGSPAFFWSWRGGTGYSGASRRRTMHLMVDERRGAKTRCGRKSTYQWTKLVKTKIGDLAPFACGTCERAAREEILAVKLFRGSGAEDGYAHGW